MRGSFMPLHRLLVLLMLAESGASYKFLAYSPMFARSHSIFMGKISDTLIDAGHEVVLLVPLFTIYEGTIGSTKARIFQVEQSEAADFMEKHMLGPKGFVVNTWNTNSFLSLLTSFGNYTEAWISQCEKTLSSPGLLDKLRAEKFDVAYTETIDVCSFIIFHLIGVKKIAVAVSLPTFETGFEITGAPTIPSYIPGMVAYYSDKMSFSERFANTFAVSFAKVFLPWVRSFYDEFAEQKYGERFPKIQELAANVSLVFVNSEPLTDFPKVTVHKMIDIGGITVSDGHSPLNETWNKIMSLRPHTVLISFGTVAKSYLMPDKYKSSIIEMFKKFPNVTFVWKYEKPGDKIASGVENVIISDWIPQNDMLYDKRLSFFITHCGAGSTTEATTAGVPLIVIPVLGDQRRNAQVVKRLGTGLILEKDNLEHSEILQDAVQKLLTDNRYRENAKRTAALIASRPFPMRDIFVRNMEFLAQFGPLNNLNHYGRNLNFFQYYVIDVVAVFALIVITVLILLLLLIRCAVKAIWRRISTKAKKE